MSSTFSYNKFTKLESNYREKNGKKNSNTWRVNNMILKKKVGQ